MIVSYDVPLQGDAINQQIVQTLLNPAKAGQSKATYYTPLTLLTKDNIGSRTMLDSRPAEVRPKSIRADYDGQSR